MSESLKTTLTSQKTQTAAKPQVAVAPANTATTTPQPTRTEKELVGVNADLAQLVLDAQKTSKQYFECTDGLRTQAEQKALVAKGASQTMNSLHLTGKAVDLVPFEFKKPRWEIPLCFIIADEVFRLARERKIPLRWGGAWNCRDITQTNKSAETLHREYIDNCKINKRRPFIDAPHYELAG